MKREKRKSPSSLVWRMGFSTGRFATLSLSHDPTSALQRVARREAQVLRAERERHAEPAPHVEAALHAERVPVRAGPVLPAAAHLHAELVGSALGELQAQRDVPSGSSEAG